MFMLIGFPTSFGTAHKEQELLCLGRADVRGGFNKDFSLVFVEGEL
jgi:hypothetical protein